MFHGKNGLWSDVPAHSCRSHAEAVEVARGADVVLLFLGILPDADLLNPQQEEARTWSPN